MTSALVAAWAVVSQPARADAAFYLSMELGAHGASPIETAATSNDRASVCDEFINPMFATVTRTPGYEDYNCTGADRGLGAGWTNAFGRAEGLLGGAALGYRLSGADADGAWRRIVVEIEYFYRDTVYDETEELPAARGTAADKLAQEIVTATDRIGSVSGHHLFVNLYWRFDGAGRFTPYVGVGAGAARTGIEYSSLWARNPNAEAILTGEGLPNADEIRRNLAGSTSSAQTRLSDTLSGHQVLFGIDYELNESATVGIKWRWSRLGTLSDEGFAWDPLRSHAPNLRRDLSEPVVGYFRTGDMEMTGVSLVLKLRF